MFPYLRVFPIKPLDARKLFIAFCLKYFKTFNKNMSIKNTHLKTKMNQSLLTKSQDWTK